MRGVRNVTESGRSGTKLMNIERLKSRYISILDLKTRKEVSSCYRLVFNLYYVAMYSMNSLKSILWSVKERYMLLNPVPRKPVSEL